MMSDVIDLMSWRKILFILLFLSTNLPSAWATDYQSPRTAGLGGAGHGGPLLNDALYMNPSFISFLPSYSLSWNYTTFSGDEISTPNGNFGFYGRQINVAIQDGRSEFFQAGAAYTIREDGRFLHLGASRKILNELGVGIGWKFFFTTNDAKANTNDAIFSVTGVPEPWIQLSLIIDNLFEDETDRMASIYREVILASKIYIQGIVMLYLDPHYIPALGDNKFGYELGAEFTIFKDIFLRAGTFRNAAIPHYSGTHGRGVGIGTGWVGPRLSFDYALTRVTDSNVGLPQSTAHSFGFTSYF